MLLASSSILCNLSRQTYQRWILTIFSHFNRIFTLRVGRRRRKRVEGGRKICVGGEVIVYVKLKILGRDLFSELQYLLIRDG